MMPALLPKRTLNGGFRLFGVNNERPLTAVSPKCNLSRSTRTLGQAGASPEGEVRFLLRRSAGDLQHLIGDFKGKDRFFIPFKSRSNSSWH